MGFFQRGPHEDRLVFAAQQLGRGDHMAQGRDLGFASMPWKMTRKPWISWVDHTSSILMHLVPYFHMAIGQNPGT